MNIILPHFGLEYKEIKQFNLRLLYKSVLLHLSLVYKPLPKIFFCVNKLCWPNDVFTSRSDTKFSIVLDDHAVVPLSSNKYINASFIEVIC